MRRSTKKSSDRCVKINTRKNASNKFIDAAKRRHEAKLEIPIKINDKITICVSQEKIDKIGVENIIKEYKLKCNIK